VRGLFCPLARGFGCVFICKKCGKLLLKEVTIHQAVLQELIMVRNAIFLKFGSYSRS
jgi:hypothetical protein